MDEVTEKRSAHKGKRHRKKSRYFNVEMVVMAVAALSAVVMLFTLLAPTVNIPLLLATGVMFTVSLLLAIRLFMDSDTVRARQTDSMLQLSSSTLDVMQDGLTPDAAQSVCELLLPRTAAVAAAITDTEVILGYAGFQAAENPTGAAIRTQATRDVIADGTPRVLHSAAEIGFPEDITTIQAAIIQPLKMSGKVMGTLKLYYRNPRTITETQKSIAHGLGRLISSQIAAVEMETQRKLATSMELKMLQSQINPHFLFNTINTIASLIRTDPMKARELLREFAVFYRRTLEDSSDLILLTRELEQTLRYFSFEVARFGDDRLGIVVNTDAAPPDMMVPPFLIQPLVENAVKHAMPSEGKLNIGIHVLIHNDDVCVCVEDDGVGMDEAARQSIMNPHSSTGLGIAVKNVHDRLQGYFGTRARMQVDSELGRGTVVTLVFPDCARKDA